MKRIFTFGLLIAAAFALTNCAQKESYAPVQEELGETVPFTVVADLTAETKTYNNGLNTMWSEGDQIKLSYTFDVNGEAYTGDFNSPFTTEKGDGIFTGELGIADGLTSLGSVLGVMKISAVYPYTEDGSVVIPALTVQEGYNSTAHLAGANCPLYGDAVIETSWKDFFSGKISTPRLLLNHATSIVKVTVTNASKEPIVIESVRFGVDTDVKARTEVNNGTALEVGATADVYLVVEPFTVNPGEGNFKFWVNDTPQEIVVKNPVTLEAGKINNMKFTYEGDFPELYAVADVNVEMTADRIVPSVKTLIDFEYLKEWASNLKNHENIEGLLQEVLVAVTAGDLEAAYDALGGLPGFEHQFEIVNGYARHIEKVNYTASDYLSSFVEDIKNIKDVESLLSILDEFMRYYEVTGTKDQILGGLGNLSDYITDFSEVIAQWFPNSNNFLIQATIKWVEDKLNELLNVNIVDILSEAAANPDSYSAKILNWMLSQTQIRDAILDSIVKVIEGIEDASKDQIDLTNQAMKEAAIAQAKATALYKAKIAAHVNIEDAFTQLNQNEINKLDKSVWGIFRMILNWEKTQEVFEQLQLTKVYDIFQEISKKVEEVVVYEEGPYEITSENCEVLTPSEL